MANEIIKPPPLSDRQNIAAFLNKFTANERNNIWTHLQTDANALTIYMKANKYGGGKPELDAKVIEAMNLVVSASLLTSLRKDAILVVAV